MALHIWQLTEGVGGWGRVTDLRLDEGDGPTTQLVGLVWDQLTVWDRFHILCSDSPLPLLYHLFVTGCTTNEDQGFSVVPVGRRTCRSLGVLCT